MYYPYLRGRQFELIALREFAVQRGDKNNIIPIIEPVKGSFSSMKIALNMLIDNGVVFSLILNPEAGDHPNIETIMNELSIELSDLNLWIPTFIISNNIAEVNKILDQAGFDEVMIICSDKANTSDEDFIDFVASQRIKYIVTKENRILKRRFRDANKSFIRLDDNFNAQRRNKDYLLVPEEKFSEEHMFYKEDGYAGFADYTVLVSDFLEGGGMPYAVSIHLTYQKENSELWIRHFTSNTNDDTSNIQGKFAEAAEKAIRFLDEYNIHNSATNELREYFHSKKYPGLGTVKKVSIKNHLELINSIL